MAKAKDRTNLNARLAYSPAEAARLLGLSAAGLDRLLRSGRVPSVKLGDDAKDVG